jgi:predicted metal-binding membrane protein
MLTQLVLGVMNLAVMLVVAAVIALEKLAPRSEWIVRIIGAVAIVAGVVVVVRSVMTA